MRKGQNPNRSNPVPGFGDVVLTVVTHLPSLDGYHAQRLEVVMTCLDSMKRNAGGDFTIAIWDNGSCDTLREWIETEYHPDIFIQSYNVGKTQARLSLARMLPPQTVMTFSDDDMFYYPNWLQPQLELLTEFPSAAIVTGYPVRTSFRWGNDNTKAWGMKHGKMQVGRFIPDKWERDFCASIERDYEWHKTYTAADLDYLVEYKGLKAYATSHHCQFVARAGDIVKADRPDGRAMGEEKTFDIMMDKIGLRLATTERLTRHMGNILDDHLRNEITNSQ